MSRLPFTPRRLSPFWLAALVITLAVIACVGGPAGWSTAEPSEAEPTAPVPVANPTVGSVMPQPALLERRFLTLEFPARIREGDSDIVRLTLEVDDLGNIVPTAQIEGNVVSGEVVEVPDLYETHHVVAEARFDIAGVEVSPSGLISAPISRGQAAVFQWSVRPGEVGRYRGTVWLHLRYVDKLTGEESQKAVSAQVVEIESVNFLGLPAGIVRASGLVGALIGTVVSLPFLEPLLKLIWGKTGRKA